MKKAIEKTLRKSFVRACRQIKIVGRKRHSNATDVHHLRRLLRRCEAGLGLFSDWLPTSRTITIQQEIEKLRRLAGRIRDLDVARIQLEGRCKTLPPDLTQWFMDECDKRRTQRGKKLKAACRKCVDHDLKSKCQQILEKLKWRVLDSDARCFAKLLEKIDGLEQSLQQSLDAPGRSMTELHQVRITGRQFRDVLEILAGCIPDPDDAVTKLAEQLTEALGPVGNCHDQTTVIEFLRVLRTKTKSMPSQLVYEQTVEECKNDIEQALPETFENAKSAIDAFLLEWNGWKSQQQ